MVLEALICLKPVMLQKTLLFVLTQRSWQVDEHVFKNLQKTRETETMWTHFYKTHTHTHTQKRWLSLVSLHCSSCRCPRKLGYHKIASKRPCRNEPILWTYYKMQTVLWSEWKMKWCLYMLVDVAPSNSDSCGFVGKHLICESTRGIQTLNPFNRCTFL